MTPRRSPSRSLPLLHRSITAWYRLNARTLPWRETRDPYKILVSEVMLQQTQVARVLQKYPRFISRFPSFAALARSSKAAVIRAWSGMGYNNRAVRLRELARMVRTQYGGKLPSDAAELQMLPGIGKYTAHAVACFAFGQRVPLVDTNIARVLGRLFRLQDGDPWRAAEWALPTRKAYDWNQGLMELGATVCTSARPACVRCPVVQLCPSAFVPVRRKAGTRKTEPGRDGVPNRIYRGRIIELLRRSPGTGSGVSEIGKRIKNGYSERDRKWLLRILEKLERDGLVQSRHTGNRRRVRLAS